MKHLHRRQIMRPHVLSEYLDEADNDQDFVRRVMRCFDIRDIDELARYFRYPLGKHSRALNSSMRMGQVRRLRSLIGIEPAWLQRLETKHQRKATRHVQH